MANSVSEVLRFSVYHKVFLKSNILLGTCELPLRNIDHLGEQTHDLVLKGGLSSEEGVETLLTFTTLPDFVDITTQDMKELVDVQLDANTGVDPKTVEWEKNEGSFIRMNAKAIWKTFKKQKLTVAEAKVYAAEHNYNVFSYVHHKFTSSRYGKFGVKTCIFWKVGEDLLETSSQTADIYFMTNYYNEDGMLLVGAPSF